MVWREEFDCEVYGIRVNPKTPPALTALPPSLYQRTLHHYTLLPSLHQEFEVGYDILEIEFYSLKEECHEDPYTDEMEGFISGRWYVH